LFPGLYTPSGKPFIEHLVGTASILVALRRSPDTVVAGLLHAAYTSGDFGLAGLLSSTRRAAVRRAVGGTAEALIWTYDKLPWDARARASLHGRLDALDSHERETLVLRLANTLELHLDLAALYCPNADVRRRMIEREGARIVSMAERLGLPALAGAMRQAFQETLDGTVPPELRSRSGRTRVHFVRPLSYRRKLPSAIGHRLRQILMRRREVRA
jgi:(p)ppGpp synthase/HD superfamily hydrolase